MDWNESIDLTGQDDLDTSQVVGWQDKQANYSFRQSDVSLDETLESSFNCDDPFEEQKSTPKPDCSANRSLFQSNLKAAHSNSSRATPFGQSFIPMLNLVSHNLPPPVIEIAEPVIELERPSSPVFSSKFYNDPTQTLDSPENTAPLSPVLSQSYGHEMKHSECSTSLQNKAEPQSVDERYIAGVKVHFPVKAYPAQVLIMFKLITGITKHQHCLMESPTGTGKTLALLCGALAWQKHERERLFKQKAETNPGFFTPSKCASRPTTNILDDSAKPVFSSTAPTQLLPRKSFGMKSVYYDSDDDVAFVDEPVQKSNVPAVKSAVEDDKAELVHIHKRPKMSSSHTSPGKFSSTSSPEVNHTLAPSTNPNFISVQTTPTKNSSNVSTAAETPENVRVPKIYYGTRTHKQLQQVIREFKKTIYAKDIHMTILSSREQTCINPCDSGAHKNKDELCKELLDTKVKPKGGGAAKTACESYNNKHQLHHGVLPPVWDIEELCSTGVDRCACPFFAAKSMMETADIIFCPYNYIIDPNIRKTMSLDLNDSIIILDEAHNIEDTCREAGSITIDQTEVTLARSDLLHILNTFCEYGLREHYNNLINCLGLWSDWFVNNAPMMAKKSDFESVYIFEGQELVASLNNHRIGVMQYKGFSKSAYMILESFRSNGKSRTDPELERGESKPQKPMTIIATATANFLEKMVFILPFLFSSNCDDFLGALKRKSEFLSTQSQTGWLSKNNPSTSSELTLAVWCMNPALIFAELKLARCIALGSGTLSPAESLPSELSTVFPLTVNGNHVIPKERVWVGSLSYGPNNELLECTYRNNGKTDFQDAIGEVLLWVCRNTPNGVLCFIPSYKLMENLLVRWTSTGLWNKLEDIKDVFTEARNGRDHTETMNKFYASVETDTGALLFAVFRGKVSEGMDFRDHQARAVVSIGIPFPNSYDELVSRKMKYNDKHRAAKGLLSGSDWLQIQAFRALNQALGRCVRHANDWGAVLLVDSRFSSDRYTKYISKWVRELMSNQMYSWDKFTRGPQSLDKFMKRMTLSETETR